MIIYKLLENEHAKHSHLGVWSNKANTGFSTVNEGHSHILVLGNDGSVVAMPGDGQNHGHFSEKYEAKEKKNKQEEAEIIAEQVELFEESSEYMADAIKQAEEDEKFYNNDQWEGKDREKLGNKKAILTMNFIEPMIDVLSGIQRQNRTDIKYMPVEGGDQIVADCLNVVTKTLLTSSDFECVETEAFVDTAVVGLGIWNVFIDYSENLYGNPVVERFPWKDVRFGRHLRPDLSDCEYIFKCRWYSLAKTKQLWPEKADFIGPTTNKTVDGGQSHTNFASNQYKNGANINQLVYSDSKYYNTAKKEIRILERWQKEYTKIPVLVFDATEEVQVLNNMPKKDVNLLGSISGFRIINKDDVKIRIIITAGDVVLDDYYPNLAKNMFHIIPIWGKHYNDENGLGFRGKVRSSKDPQKTINKQACQTIDNVANTNNSTYFYDDDTFGGRRELENEFKEKVNTPGHVQKVTKLSNIPVRMDPPPLHTAAAEVIQMSRDLFRNITNVNPELQGLSSNASSGIAINLRRQSALIGNEFLFDNLSFAKKQLGRLIVAIIQKIYTPERILRIIENQNQVSPIKVNVGNEQVNLFDVKQKQEIIDMLSNVDLMKYDIAVSENPQSATAREHILNILLDAAGKGIQISPESIIEYSPMPQGEKEKSIQAIRMMQQQAAQMEKMKYDTEKEKSLIAAQSKLESEKNKQENRRQGSNAQGRAVGQQ